MRRQAALMSNEAHHASPKAAGRAPRAHNGPSARGAKQEAPHGPLQRLLERTSVKAGAGIQAREPQRQRQPAVEELALPSAEPAAAT